MTRADARIIRHAAILALPPLLLAALAVAVLVRGVPLIVKSERGRIAMEAKLAADNLKHNPESSDFIWEYGKGVTGGDAAARDTYPAEMAWKDWRPRDTRKDRMWGYLQHDSGMVVWTRVDSRIFAKELPVVEIDYALWFWTFGVAILAVFLVLSLWAVYRLAKYAKTRNDFLAASAHDLATPLVGLRSKIGFDDAEAKRLVERLLKMVGNINAFIHPGKRRFARSVEFDLCEAYGDAYSLFAEDFRACRGGADVELDAPARLMAVGDELAVQQVLWNLLGNALKYAAPSGPVKVRIYAEGAMARVEVADSGPGMSRAQRRRAFSRYFRGGPARKSGKGGFGIGLCVARELARALGGSLALRPNGPSGCVFTFSIPLAQ